MHSELIVFPENYIVQPIVLNAIDQTLRIANTIFYQNAVNVKSTSYKLTNIRTFMLIEKLT